MSRIFKILLFVCVLAFSLACALISKPIDDVRNAANTAQAFATDAIALATQAAPIGTLIANPSLIPDVGNLFNPEGTPLAEWNGIPVMPQATAGQEFNSTNYSFKFSGAIKDAEDFYNDALPKLGWSQSFAMPGNEQEVILAFSKDTSTLVITITTVEDSILVLLTLA